MQRQLNNYRVLSLSKAKHEAMTGKSFLKISSALNNENRGQPEGKFSDNIFQCEVYIRQLIRVFGPPPKGCEFFIMQIERHRYEVNIFYIIPCLVEEMYPGPTTANISEWSEQEKFFKENQEYLIRVQNGLETWDDSSLQELEVYSHFIDHEN